MNLQSTFHMFSLFLSTASCAVVPGVPDIPEISHLDQAPTPENAVPRRPSLLQVPTTPLEDLQGESRTWRILEIRELNAVNPIENYQYQTTIWQWAL
jgi:hypothetical protein